MLNIKSIFLLYFYNDLTDRSQVTNKVQTVTQLIKTYFLQIFCIKLVCQLKLTLAKLSGFRKTNVALEEKNLNHFIRCQTFCTNTVIRVFDNFP